VHIRSSGLCPIDIPDRSPPRSLAANLGSNASGLAVSLYTGRAQSAFLSLAQLVQHLGQAFNDDHISDRGLFLLSVRCLGVRLVHYFIRCLLQIDVGRYTEQSVANVVGRHLYDARSHTGIPTPRVPRSATTPRACLTIFYEGASASGINGQNSPVFAACSAEIEMDA
jgi:hypothetical protein